MSRGACYSLTLPRKLTKKAINHIFLEIDPEKSFEIIFHSRGLLSKFPYSTIDYFSTLLFPGKSIIIHIDYQQKVFMDLDGQKCVSEAYEFAQCIESNIHKVIFLSSPDA